MKNSQLSISEKDAQIISDVVLTFWNDGYPTIKTQVLRIFAKDITADHLIMIGQVIGIKSLTDSKEAAKTKLYESNN